MAGRNYSFNTFFAVKSADLQVNDCTNRSGGRCQSIKRKMEQLKALIHG